MAEKLRNIPKGDEKVWGVLVYSLNKAPKRKLSR